ncbi:MAG: hypothetical protein IEMM0008_0001 [bacterium]|nr:MAG: hypothetical protein IEMM0008_0001 [bacterium]
MLVLRIMIAIIVSSITLSVCINILIYTNITEPSAIEPITTFTDLLVGFTAYSVLSLAVAIIYLPLTLLLYNRINIKLFYLIILIWSITPSFLFASYWFKELILLVTISGIISSIVYCLTLYKTRKWESEDGSTYWRTLFAWFLFFSGPGIISLVDLLLVNKSELRSGISDQILFLIHFILALIALVYVYLDTKALIHIWKRISLVILQALIAFFAYIPVFGLYLKKYYW